MTGRERLRELCRRRPARCLRLGLHRNVSLLALIALTGPSLLRTRMSFRSWQVVHRTAYA